MKRAPGRGIGAGDWAALMHVALVSVLLSATAAAAPRYVAAQEAPPSATTPSELPPPLPISPGGAFLRSLLVPGWGHAAIGAHGRGGFYFALESATLYTFVRTRRRLSDARERASLRESVVRANLANEGITDPIDIEAALAADATLMSLQDLVDSRRAQQEDLIAWGIFVLFLSGADAYVSAHLARFPEPLDVDVSPVAFDRAEVTLRLRLPELP